MKSPDKSCSVCNHASFRKCDCPWGKPFDKWTGDALAKLRKMFPSAGT